MTVRYLSFTSIMSLIDCLFENNYISNTYIFKYILQLARTVIMDKTVLVFAPQTARHVNLQTAHVVVMLVGWGKIVVLVLYF